MWRVETLDDVVDAELAALPTDMRVRFDYVAALIETFGLEKVKEPHVKQLEGPLWEMRLKRPGRYLPRDLFHGDRMAGDGGAGFRQEDAGDATQGTENHIEESKGSKAMTTSRELHKK